jgi:heme exporter protein C
VWDARLTSSLILLFLYLGYLLLIAAIEDTQRADAAGALLALVGAVNVPIIYFSVRWWNTLHQGASLSPSGGSRLAPSMLAALLVCTLACWIYAFAVIFLRARALVLEREASTRWARQLGVDT